MPSSHNALKCLNCGADLVAARSKCDACQIVVAMPAEQERFLEQRLPILVIMFAVTGVLGLPLLWLSPAFSRRGKITWTIIVTIYTVALVTIAGAACKMAWESYMDFFTS